MSFHGLAAIFLRLQPRMLTTPSLSSILSTLPWYIHQGGIEIKKTSVRDELNSQLHGKNASQSSQTIPIS